MRSTLLLACLPLLSNALSVPMEDSLSSQKFNIIYVPSLDENIDSIKETNGDGTIFSLGNDMKCFIPSETKLSLLQRINNNATAWNQLLSTSLGQGVDIIDSQLDKKCINQGNGFWKYQLCYAEDFIQYHESPNNKDFVNKLGSYFGNPDSTEQTEISLLFDNEIGYYISEILHPGDVCDLTGKKREVEVQYVCGLNKESPTIQWVKEIATCLYEARVMVPDLCQLELFAKNEDKLSATEIVCERSVPEGRKKGIIDIISDFDPVFLNNEIFLLKPNNNQHEILLLYTGEFKSSLQMESVLFDIFGKAFNKIINAKLLKGPNNEVISLKDSFEWYAPVIDSNSNYLFTFYLKMLPGGKAELFLKPQENNAQHLNNNFLSFTSNGLDNVFKDNKKAAKEQAKKKKQGLTLKNENGDIISVEKVADPMDQGVFVVNVVDDDGEPVPMNDQARGELLKTLFDTQVFQDMVEQIRDENEEDGEKIQFLHSKSDEHKPAEVAEERQHEDASVKETVTENNLVRNIHVEDNQSDTNVQKANEDNNSEDTTYKQNGEPAEPVNVVDDSESTSEEPTEHISVDHSQNTTREPTEQVALVGDTESTAREPTEHVAPVDDSENTSEEPTEHVVIVDDTENTTREPTEHVALMDDTKNTSEEPTEHVAPVDDSENTSEEPTEHVAPVDDSENTSEEPTEHVAPVDDSENTSEEPTEHVAPVDDSENTSEEPTEHVAPVDDSENTSEEPTEHVALVDDTENTTREPTEHAVPVDKSENTSEEPTEHVAPVDDTENANIEQEATHNSQIKHESETPKTSDNAESFTPNVQDDNEQEDTLLSLQINEPVQTDSMEQINDIQSMDNEPLSVENTGIEENESEENQEKIAETGAVLDTSTYVKGGASEVKSQDLATGLPKRTFIVEYRTKAIHDEL